MVPDARWHWANGAKRGRGTQGNRAEGRDSRPLACDMRGRTIPPISRFTEQFSEFSAQATHGHCESATRHKRTWSECRPIDNSGFQAAQLMPTVAHLMMFYVEQVERWACECVTRGRRGEGESECGRGDLPLRGGGEEEVATGGVGVRG